MIVMTSPVSMGKQFKIILNYLIYLIQSIWKKKKKEHVFIIRRVVGEREYPRTIQIK